MHLFRIILCRQNITHPIQFCRNADWSIRLACRLVEFFMRIFESCVSTKIRYWLFMLNMSTLQWHHNGRDGVSNLQPHHCLLNRLLSCRSKKTSKLYVTGLCAGNSPLTGEFLAQMASSAKNVTIWWRHHACETCSYSEKAWACDLNGITQRGRLVDGYI